MMKKKISSLLIPLILLAVLVGAYVGYRAFAPEVVPDEPAPAPGETVPYAPPPEGGEAPAAVPAEAPKGKEDAGLGAAPDFTVADADGNAVSLWDFAGKPVVVNFWATWCPPCASELPHFDKAAADYADEVQFMMVDLTDGVRDTVDDVKAYVADKGYSFPVFFDTEGDGANTYGVYSIPSTVFIGADGSIRYARLGAMDETTLYGYIERILDR